MGQGHDGTDDQIACWEIHRILPYITRTHIFVVPGAMPAPPEFAVRMCSFALGQGSSANHVSVVSGFIVTWPLCTPPGSALGTSLSGLWSQQTIRPSWSVLVPSLVSRPQNVPTAGNPLSSPRDLKTPCHGSGASSTSPFQGRPPCWGVAPTVPPQAPPSGLPQPSDCTWSHNCFFLPQTPSSLGTGLLSLWTLYPSAEDKA